MHNLSLELAKWCKQKGYKLNELANTIVQCPALFGLTEFHFQHVSVQRWLYEIFNAKYVITNSFHATVFCILFHKKFVTINNHSGGSDRIKTLFKQINLEYRLIDDLNKLEDVLYRDIDYVEVDVKLDKFRMESMNYLKQSLA